MARSKLLRPRGSPLLRRLLSDVSRAAAPLPGQGEGEVGQRSSDAGDVPPDSWEGQLPLRAGALAAETRPWTRRSCPRVSSDRASSIQARISIAVWLIDWLVVSIAVVNQR